MPEMFRESNTGAEPIDPGRFVPSIEKKSSDLRENAFHAVIYRHLSDEFDADLEECHFSPEEINIFNESLSKLSENQILGFFSIPWEIRLKRFDSIKKKIQNGFPVTEMVKNLADEAEKKGYRLGYHISPIAINPEQKSDIHEPTTRPEWKISGYEYDDRDERPMAYYSLDYKNLYRKKRGSHLYIVRAETGSATDHKRDTSNNWGRTSTLSIIAEFPIAEIDEEVGKVEQELKNRQASVQGGGDAAS